MQERRRRGRELGRWLVLRRRGPEELQDSSSYDLQQEQNERTKLLQVRRKSELNRRVQRKSELRMQVLHKSELRRQVLHAILMERQ